MVEEPQPLDGVPDRADLVAELYRSEYLPMVRLAHLITGSNEVAEDVVQDAFVKMHRSWDRADRPGAYLRTIVVNGCNTWHRRRRMERERLPRAVAEAVDSEAHSSWTPSPAWASGSGPHWCSGSTPTCPRPMWRRPSAAAPER